MEFIKMAFLSLSRCFHYNSILINWVIFDNTETQTMLQSYLNLGYFSTEFRDVSLFFLFLNCHIDTEQMALLKVPNSCYHKSVFH